MNCGSNLGIIDIDLGESVLDLGCVRGNETIEAARLAGQSGKSVGLDITTSPKPFITLFGGALPPKKGTFDQVVAGIEAAVTNNTPVNLRSMVESEDGSKAPAETGCCCGRQAEVKNDQ